MIHRAWVAAVLTAAWAGGCGTQSVLLGTEGEYLLTTFDALARPGEEVTLRARLQAGDLLSAKSGYVVRFRRESEFFKAAETGRDGIAAVSFTPPQAGDYRFSVEVSPSGFADQPPAPRPLLVACRAAEAPMLVVDMDKTLVASGFEQVLIGQPEPMPDSPAVMKRLAERYTIVYLTHRPDYFGPKSKAWLAEQGYPSGPVLLSNVGEFLSGSGAFKSAVLEQLKKRFSRIEIGIGDKVSDAQAYLDNGLKAFLILQISPQASSQQLRQQAESIRALPEAAQVVTGWNQIGKAVFEGGSFGRSRMVEELTKLADLRELEKSLPLK